MKKTTQNFQDLATKKGERKNIRQQDKIKQILCMWDLRQRHSGLIGKMNSWIHPMLCRITTVVSWKTPDGMFVCWQTFLITWHAVWWATMGSKALSLDLIATSLASILLNIGKLWYFRTPILLSLQCIKTMRDQISIYGDKIAEKVEVKEGSGCKFMCEG